jgi:hypothetical protein
VCSIDYNHESNSIGVQRKLDRLNQPFVSDHSQLEAFKHSPYQLFNGAGNSSNIQDISSYAPDGLGSFNASQQQLHTSATPKDINHTMTFVSQIAPKHTNDVPTSSASKYIYCILYAADVA